MALQVCLISQGCSIPKDSRQAKV
uniref:Uncharacterized protein n=1 Tax=Anguilla anguilla TaxID=7936 RepID=A0A0E9XIS6_ANGAN